MPSPIFIIKCRWGPLSYFFSCCVCQIVSLLLFSLPLKLSFKNGQGSSFFSNSKMTGSVCSLFFTFSTSAWRVSRTRPSHFSKEGSYSRKKKYKEKKLKAIDWLDNGRRFLAVVGTTRAPGFVCRPLYSPRLFCLSVCCVLNKRVALHNSQGPFSSARQHGKLLCCLTHWTGRVALFSLHSSSVDDDVAEPSFFSLSYMDASHNCLIVDAILSLFFCVEQNIRPAARLFSRLTPTFQLIPSNSQ